MQATQTPPTRPRLSQRQVLTTALSVIDQEGLDALSMRRLGVELGTDPMNIYHHVGKKEELFDGVAALLWEEVVLPAEDKDTITTLRELARSVRGLFQRHPEAATLILRCSTLNRTLLTLFRAYLDKLTSADLEGRDPASILRPLLSYAMGYGHAENTMLGVQCPPATGQNLSREEVLLYLGQALPEDTSPPLAEAAKAMIADCNFDQCFEDGLDLMLSSISSHASN
jgi:AcrR family transcriptional regulator